MRKTKINYEQPSCELLVVRFEGNIMSAGSITNQGTEEGNPRDGDEEGYGWN